MRIAVVHSFYDSRNASGENFVVLSQVNLMRSYGHEVKLFGAYTDELINDPFYVAKSSFKVATGIGMNPLKEIRDFQPDVTFIHNLFPNFGSNWMKEIQGLVVQVLHNYRLFCANGTFFRNNGVCFDCARKSPLEGIKNACYRGSKVATLPLSIAQKRRSLFRDDATGPDIFIALSIKAAETLISSGLDESKTTVIPNFVEDFTKEKSELLGEPLPRWVAVGRITREKGFYNLVENWPLDVDLDIIGDGEDLERVKEISSSKPNIMFLGKLQKSELLQRLSTYTGAIHPSIWIEVSPLTLIEFFCAGLPVISLEITSGLVVGNPDTPAGVVVKEFTPQSLTSAIEQIVENRNLYSINARSSYLTDYTPQKWMTSIESMISSLVSISRQSEAQ